VNLHRNRNQTPTSAQIGGSDLGEAPSKLISSLSPSPSISSATTLLKSIPGGITCQEEDLMIKNGKSGKIILVVFTTYATSNTSLPEFCQKWYSAVTPENILTLSIEHLPPS
jgi:hypothetical protein